MTFTELSRRSSQVAGWLRGQGLRRGDHLLLLLSNCVPLWEITLAAMKIGVVLIPTTPLLGPADLADRVRRGEVALVVAHSADTGKFADVPGGYARVAVGEPVPGWLRYGDVHLNISSPGWGKHAWSNVFAPWNAGATVLVHNVRRFSAAALLDVLVRCQVSTFCAPPTVWRMLVQADLTRWPVAARELVSAGEPLNPEVIEQVRRAWGTTVRDGYGQTETTAQIGNSPGQPVRPGSMGRPLPGYRVTLLDPITGEPGDEGEICLDLSPRPVGLMAGYSPMWGALTTCSRRPTTGSHPSSWRAC